MTSDIVEALDGLKGWFCELMSESLQGVNS